MQNVAFQHWCHFEKPIDFLSIFAPEVQKRQARISNESRNHLEGESRAKFILAMPRQEMVGQSQRHLEALRTPSVLNDNGSVQRFQC